MSGAIWPGDAKWEVSQTGQLAPLSLRQLCLSNIAENLGSVCNIQPRDPRTVCYRESNKFSACENTVKTSETANGSCAAGKAAIECECPNLNVYSHSSHYNSSFTEAVGSCASGSVSCVSDNSVLSDSVKDIDEGQRMIPYSVFNVPNYGKVYDKSESTVPPGDDRERTEIFNRDFYNFEFRDQDCYLSPHTASMLFEEMDRCGMLNDSVMSLFSNTPLKFYQVVIRRCGSAISSRGLQLLKHQRLHRLELHRPQIHTFSLSDVLSPWTKENLTVLSLPHYSPPITHGANNEIFNFIKQLRNLQELDLSHNGYLQASTLQELLQQLPRLWRLNISQCENINTIEPLLIVAHQLQHLHVAGVIIDSISVTVAVLKKLTKLRYLDASTDSSSITTSEHECINEVLVDPEFAPDIEYLDVSNQRQVSQRVLKSFLDTHSKIKCVGLINVPLCDDFDIAKWPHVKFLRDVYLGDERSAVHRLTECLTHYRCWPHVLNRILSQTNVIISATTTPQPALIASILRVLETHQNNAIIQASGSACLHNLTYGSRGLAIHPSLLRSVVHAIIHAMTRHSNNHLLQKNGLLLLCCESVLHHVSFNQYWVALMALHALHNYNDDSVDLMAVGICSILAAKLTNEQTAHLGSNPAFMSKLLSLVRGRMEDDNADITLQFTLSALWNLTDESPDTCEIFLNQDGLQLFINLLLAFPKDPAVETKVLGLFNNVAEVPALRAHLLKPPFIVMLRRQLQSTHIAVSYFAAGISAHLICADKAAWYATDDLPYEELLAELGKAVMGWETQMEEMVAYKSFQPFLPLLRAAETPHVQLWALWALHHVTVNNSKYYCPMMIREGIPCLLEATHEDTRYTAPFVSDLAGMLLELLSRYRTVENQVGQPDLLPVYTPRARNR